MGKAKGERAPNSQPTDTAPAPNGDFLAQAIGQPEFMAAGVFSAESRQLWQRINTYLASLPPAQRQAAIDQIRNQVKPGVGPMGGLSSQDLQGVYGGLVHAFGPDPNPDPAAVKQTATPAAQPGSAPASTASPAAAGSTTTVPGLGQAIQPDRNAALTDQQYVDLMKLWGLTDKAAVDHMISSFNASYTVTYGLNRQADLYGGPPTGAAGADASKGLASPPLDPTSAAAGIQSALTAGKPAPWTMSMHPRQAAPTGRSSTASNIRDMRSLQDLTAQDVYYAATMASGGISNRVLLQYEQIYRADTGQDMPAALQAEVQQAISGLSSSGQEQLLEQSILYPGMALRGKFSSIDTVLSAWETAHPTPTQAQQTALANLSKWTQQYLGRPATAADLAAAGGANLNDVQAEAWVRAQPSDVKGMNAGNRYDSWGRLRPLWQQYYGKDPTNAELQWSVGRSNTDLMDHINNSPSRVPNVTIGRYQDYVGFMQGAKTHEFSAGVTDDMIAELHGAVTK